MDKANRTKGSSKSLKAAKKSLAKSLKHINRREKKAKAQNKYLEGKKRR